MGGTTALIATGRSLATTAEHPAESGARRSESSDGELKQSAARWFRSNRCWVVRFRFERFDSEEINQIQSYRAMCR